MLELAASEPVDKVRARTLGYVLAALLVVLAFMLGFGGSARPNQPLLTALVVLSISSALFIGSVALIRHYVQKRSTYLWVGAGFFGVALLEVFHALQVLGLEWLGSRPDQADLMAWSWLAAKTALALYLLLGWLADARRRRKNGARSVPSWAVYLIVGVSAVASVGLLLLLPTPGPFLASGSLGQPFELLPAVPLLVTLVGYLARGTWRSNSFEHALNLALILMLGASTLLLPFSQERYDTLFYLGHTAQLAAYLVIVAGLLVSTYRVFRLAEERRMASLRSAFELTKERERVTTSLQDLRVKEAELQRKVRELETTRSAVLNIMEDLNLEKRALAREKAKDEAILASVGEGLIVTDRERRITFMNSAAEQMMGYRLAEAAGQRWPEIMRARDEDQVPLTEDDFVIARALRTLTPKSTLKPEVFTRKDGSTFVAASTTAPVLLDEQQEGAIVVFRDVTREREIDRAKTEFVSLASHQLRTPLSTIKWYVEMLLEGDAGKLKPEQQDYLAEVERANVRMVNLVNALLNVSRIEVGTFSVQPEPTDLVEIAQTVLKEHAHAIKTKSLRVQETYDKNTPLLSVDPNLTRIIFQNLIDNAIKYTPSRGKVQIRVRPVQSGDRVDNRTVRRAGVVLEVEDTGFGIPAAAQPRIFTKLFRADNVKVRETDGTGLGLYIVKSILDHSDGDVWFESEEGKGSTFFVLLPLTGMTPRAGTKRLT